MLVRIPDVFVQSGLVNTRVSGREVFNVAIRLGKACMCGRGGEHRDPFGLMPWGGNRSEAAAQYAANSKVSSQISSTVSRKKSERIARPAIVAEFVRISLAFPRIESLKASPLFAAVFEESVKLVHTVAEQLGSDFR
jgi:hypothetical protein